MRVYHFVNANYGLENIQRRRLKISRIMDLNDPFEFLGVDLSNREFRWALRETKKQLSNDRRILCFSKSWRNPVQWAHYGDRHKGLCLGFDVPGKFVRKVQYVEERFEAPVKPNLKFMSRVLLTKFAHWHYEQEYRAFVSLDTQVDGHYFFRFSKDLQLRRVIVGPRSSVSRHEVTTALRGLKADVEVFKARAAFRPFEVVRNRDDSMWV